MATYVPRFSVLLPVYNGAAYLAKSIDSVLAQEYRDYELLICDDGSADESRAVLASYKDERIVPIRHKDNRGLFPTLNELANRARGQLLHLWTQDDMMKPNCLAEEAAFWGMHPTLGMSYSLYDVMDENGHIYASNLDNDTPEIMPYAVVAEISVYHGSMPGNISNVVLNRDALLAVGGFDERYTVAGDFELWVRLARHYHTGLIRKCLVNQRNHEGQFSRQRRSGLISYLETEELYGSLVVDVPPALRPYVRNCLRWGRTRAMFHHMLRKLMRGDFEEVREIAAALHRGDEKLGLLFLIWLITLNGRVLMPRPRYWEALSGSANA